MSRVIGRAAAAAIVLAGCANLASAQINGLFVSPRVFNDYPSSTLVVTNSNSNPGNVTISESAYLNATGTGANRHDVLVSADHGATAKTFDISNPFRISMTVNLADGSNSPRKEAGIRINAPVTGDALFIVNSDAGEIVAFGGGAPFKLFGNNGGGNGYTPGTPLFMAMDYTPGTGGGAATVQYYINRTAANGFGAGVETSGPLLWSNLEGGPTNFTLGAYVQAGVSNTVTPNVPSTDFVNAAFSNITTIVPEPASLVALAMGGAVLGRRRR